MERNSGTNHCLWNRVIGMGKKEVNGLKIGANKNVGIEALRGDMGWSCFEKKKRINETKIKYRGRLKVIE